MIPIYCTQGHLNASENRFCSTCGQKLLVARTGVVLGERYRIIRELGQGGFGRTYLAEDINRFNETCVLKEFAPQVQGDEALQKAEALFEREAGVLYKLQHPQIPRFRELFRADVEGCDRLFLVQDYVAGPTYQQLLETRQRQGTCFSEAEVRQFLSQILPVLQYLHQAGVIHRDISLDNLILRSIDTRPVLIDFGGVKQIAAAATSKYTRSAETNASVTRLGKIGYAPQEQIQQGIVSPQSDLYALAVTVLVLLTGKEPSALLDHRNGVQPWQQMLHLNPDLKSVLTRMLAPNPAERFASAQAVLQALSSAAAVAPTVAPAKSTAIPAGLTAATIPVTPAAPVAPTAAAIPAAPAASSRSRFPSFLLLLLPLAFLGGAAWWWRDQWLPLLAEIAPVQVEPAPTNSLEAQAKAAGVDYGFLVELINATFYERHPDQVGRTLSDTDADAALRRDWAKIADEWLDLLPQHLSQAARQKLGSYTESERDQWKQGLNQLYVSSRALYDLTDAQFFQLFPEQRDREFLAQPIGQVWQGLASDQIQALKAGKTLEHIEFAAGAYSAQISSDLAVGAGRVYLANLAAEQIMRLNLQAPAESTLLSIYLPRPTKALPTLLEDGTESTWTGTLPQSGYYEIVVVNTATQPISYRLNLSVDNVTSTPIEPEQGEAPTAKE